MRSEQPSQVILNTVVMGLGMHPGAWRFRDGSAYDYTDLAYFEHIARVSEKGAIHAIFLADTLAVSEENYERPNLGALDPTVVLSVLAGMTSHLGLIATASTTFNEPYNIARRISSLDHLSGGRAAWNIVTTFVPDVAANFGNAGLPQHDDRYVKAEEFVDIVVKLWESWGEGSTVGDKTRPVFADPTRIHAVDHEGPNYWVKGPLTLPRTPQVRPVLFQAGSSGPGRNLAARVADVVFTAQNTTKAALEFRADIRRRVQQFGRNPDKVKVMPGLMPVLGGTEAEARARKDKLDECGGQAELKKLALRVGCRVEDLKLDQPLPVEKILANDKFRASEGFRAAALRLSTEENLTVREILYRNGGGHRQVVGTPEQVADTIETLWREGAADGFNIMIDAFPTGLDDFVNEVVPLLQKRGIFRTEPVGRTLRESLGIDLLHEHDKAA
ncbi:MAG: LLM class flavin-dependent oxidoreductase [Hyphomicrobiaceae bacterium]